MKEFEDLTQKELKEMYEKVKEQEKTVNEPVERPTRWRAKKGEIYWFATSGGRVLSLTEEHDHLDEHRYATGNYFKPKKYALEYKKKQLYQQEYKDWCKFDIDWDNNYQIKWYAYYNYPYKKIECDYNVIQRLEGATYAESKERIQEFIDKIGKKNFKKYILEI